MLSFRNERSRVHASSFCFAKDGSFRGLWSLIRPLLYAADDYSPSFNSIWTSPIILDSRHALEVDRRGCFNGSNRWEDLLLLRSVRLSLSFQTDPQCAFVWSDP